MAVMKIYLAGKIGFRDWRHDVVDGLCNADLETHVIKRAIRSRHDYVGPFFIDGQHGSGHGEGTHGAGETHYNKNTHTKVRLAVEIDGIEFHGNQSAFMSDRKRTRFLESQGWRVMRFAAKEVLAAGPCEDCANEVWDAVASLQIENAEKQRQIEALNEREAKRALSEA